MPVTNYIWDELSDNVLMETDENDALVANYTCEPSQFGEVLSQHRANNDQYFNFDGLGSTRDLTGNTQTVSDSYTYSAFGETVSSSGSTTNPFQWNGAVGYYTNEETGEFYVRRRSYDPAIARWLSRDPLGFVDGPNVYAIVRNQPIGMNDPSGLTYFRARYYDPTTGEFISKDPLEYVDGMSFYRGYFVPNYFDPGGTCTKKECQVESFDLKTEGCKTSTKQTEDGKEKHYGYKFSVDAKFKKPNCECCSYRQYVCCDMIIKYVVGGKVVRQFAIEKCDHVMSPSLVWLPQFEEDCGPVVVKDPRAPGGFREIIDCYGHRDDPNRDDDKYFNGGCSYHMDDHPGVTYENIVAGIDKRITVKFEMDCQFALFIIDTCNDDAQKASKFLRAKCSTSWQGQR